MAKYFRFDSKDLDDSLLYNVIGMLTGTPIVKTRLHGKDGMKRTFEINVMQEESQSVTITYNSYENATELKLMKLFKKEGTLLLMNNCFISHKQPLQMELKVDDDLCILACRPNAYQIDRFMKVILITIF